jgi:hypothetical protein
MNKEIYYHQGEAYLILRKIKMSNLNPRQYGIDSDDFWICETIKHAEIVN